MSQLRQDATVLAPHTKPSIALVHGFRGSPLGLETIAKDLRQAGYTVYTPAMPPFAGAGELEAYQPKAYARYLANYIRKHQLQRPILIGHSMGSVVVSATAKFYPELVNQKLVLLSPIPTKTAWPFALVAPLASIVPRNIVDYITTRYLFVPKSKELFRQTLDITHACSEDLPPSHAAMAAATKFSTHYGVQDFLPNQETLLIAGAKDRLVPQKQVRHLAERLQSDLKLIPGSGHLHNYEKPHETAELILEFLQK